jgi:hypothetical protein
MNNEKYQDDSARSTWKQNRINGVLLDSGMEKPNIVCFIERTTEYAFCQGSTNEAFVWFVK